MHPGVNAPAEASTHQLVGYVTKMFPTFGYINNEIFFQKKCVIGPMVEIGDNVATSAVYQPNMPIKWSAEKVWRVQDSRHSRSHDRSEEKEARLEKERSPRKSADRESMRSREKAYDERHEKRDEHFSRKRSLSPASRRSISGGRSRRSVETHDAKRRRVSPESTSVHSSGVTYSQAITKRLLNTSFLLNAKELLIPDLRCRFSSILAPVDLYRVVCHWQNSFPLLKPFYPEGSSVYQVVSCPKQSQKESESGYFVNVLLMSMPQMTSLHEKTVIRAENMDRTRGSLRKYIQILASAKANDGFKAIGGSWRADLDGPDPAKDPRTLINTAIRVCKEQLKLDLSSCTQWHRFLEFRYGRTEGSTARPTSVLFPGSDLWGRKYSDPQAEVPTPSKPFHKIVVYFLPDVWSLVPSASEWPKVRKAFETLTARGQHPMFPLSNDLLKQALNETPKGSTGQSDGPKSDSTAEGTVKESSEPLDKEASPLGIADPSLTEAPSRTPTGNQMPSKEANATAPADSAEKSVLKSHDELNLSTMKVSELREQLKVRNMPADGIKVQLLSRLKAAIEKEAEEARKAEEERKQKEKEQEEQAAKELQAKKDEAERQQAAEAASKQDKENNASKTSVHLRNFPSILVQPTVPDCRVQNATLEELLEPKMSINMNPQTFELMFCAHTILEMLHRDAIFILFRALVTAGDRGVQATSRTHETRPEPKNERGTTAEVDTVRCTVDIPLLFACTMLDINARGYFHGYEAEGLIASLGLPVSRYQIRSLITKVADSGRIHYRTLTDAEITPATAKSKITYSEIDDDEYLLELIRGGDAVLEESVESALPTGSVLVFHTPGGDSNSTVPSTTPGQLSAPTPLEFARQLKSLEMEKIKLFKQLKSKTDEIARLRSLTDQIPSLRKELDTATASVSDLRRRLKHEREQAHLATRVIEQQMDNLDSARVALRQASNRLRGRSDNPTPVKKSTSSSSSTTESRTSGHTDSAATKEKNQPAEQVISTDKPQSEDKESVAEQSEKPMEITENDNLPNKSPIPGSEATKSSDPSVVKGSVELVNGEADDDAQKVSETVPATATAT